MKFKQEHFHFLFKIGVILKGIDGILEAIAGFALFFISSDSLRNFIDWLTQGELREDPSDFVANHLVDFFHQLSINTKHFASVYLLIYGVAKVGLVAGLLRGKLWAYPTALTVLGLFLCYQLYRVVHNRSVGLGFLSVIDLFILVLIWREYKSLKLRRVRNNFQQIPK
jgi:uncharacterized membrane protein